MAQVDFRHQSGNISKHRRALLRWYDGAARDLPWRQQGNKRPDPYAIWLSEIMLQQTTVVAVIPYFHKFLETWPTVKDLATAPLDNVLTAWAGLGYYARARNLHKCAITVMRDYDGAFPSTRKELLSLPGIGPYTAAAIAAIAFGEAAVPVDGNVIRVLSRLHGIKDPMPAKKVIIEKIADHYGASNRAGDFAQSVIELGATLCKDRNPNCPKCPLRKDCVALASGEPTAFPVKVKKKPKPTRRGWVYWIDDGRGRVLLRRRPDKGLLGGMMELPGSNWESSISTRPNMREAAPVIAEYHPISGEVTHTFTHFHLVLSCAVTKLVQPINMPAPYRWVAIDELDTEALPSLMRKAVRHCQTALPIIDL